MQCMQTDATPLVLGRRSGMLHGPQVRTASR